METHVTRWSPDTCDCVHEYSWDETLPQEDRVHTPLWSAPCLHHRHTEDDDSAISMNDRINIKKSNNYEYQGLLQKALTPNFNNTDNKRIKELTIQFVNDAINETPNKHKVWARHTHDHSHVDNMHKNNFINQLHIEIDSIAEITIDHNGNELRMLRNNKIIDFEYDNNRILHIYLTGFTNAEKSKAHAIRGAQEKYSNIVVH